MSFASLLVAASVFESIETPKEAQRRYGGSVTTAIWRGADEAAEAERGKKAHRCRL